ncbi:MAG: sialidase family protein [Dyadobacter fermentans]
MNTNNFSRLLLFGCLLTSGSLSAQEVAKPASGHTQKPMLISKGGDAGDYQAFPDACRLKNGDIVAVFYAGDEHVTKQSEKYPKAGRICLVRSKDEGKTWSKPVTIYDDNDDNRDPHISQLSNGSLVVSFFSLRYPSFGAKEYKTLGSPQLLWSRDNGKTWDKEATLLETGDIDWLSSAQVREMPDGTTILPVYHQEGRGGLKAWGGVMLSRDKGKTWGPVITIGEKANLPLAAETDVILLKDGTLYAALRAQQEVHMHFAKSKDMGKTWSDVEDIGFRGHSPSFTRLKTGEILLTTRAFTDAPSKKGYTGLRISRDEAKTWEGPYMVDETLGAYPSTVELKDGSVLVVYYEEGQGSGIRAYRFRIPAKAAPFAEPRRLEMLTGK